jgi:hypothetical protein
MDTGGTESVETRKFKDAVLAEIFTAYKESGAVCQKKPRIRKSSERCRI